VCLWPCLQRLSSLTWPGNAFAAAGHSLASQSSKRPLMGARAEPPVRSIGTDPAAFTEFYRAHVDEVTRFVTRRVADPQLAADLTAEVFLAVIDAAAQYRGSFGGPRTWLYGIARNVIAAEFRRSVRERRAESLVAGRRLLDAPADSRARTDALAGDLPDAGPGGDLITR
jgi:DNA-directed RNA polymerase specialized sigma24 family protein